MNISQYIENDLTEKIRNGSPLPTRLTLSALATEYEVSLTPIRVALENLIESKFILKGQNGRLSINPKRRAKKITKKPSTGQAIHLRNWDELITEDVIHLSVQGEPVYLREEPAAQRYGVGRTVIRQVFNRLAGAGLIDRVPRRGWRVHPFREQDMLDYIDVRETLELKALELARKRLDPLRLKEFLAVNSPDTKGKHQLDNGLHAYWIEQSENRYIQSFFAQFGMYYSYLFSYSTVATSVIEEKAAEHRKILRALLKKDWDAASNALQEHIRSQRPNVTHLFERISKRTKQG
ncbi:MAG: GntR family transcriptional regulator [Verrucomicrobia bacterium]|nr:GntR family transcriptional regulator [Verrucomicrobiota bacterium]MDA1067514.1 GntR family transcriptional regulator [Verrucomicrobiota bacterium]